jgi:hypothetical protein
MEEEGCTYIICAKLGSAYSFCVSTFYVFEEALGDAYKNTSLESFCDSLLQEIDNLVQIGVVSTSGTSNKTLLAHQKDKTKNPKKQHPHHNNKKNKGLKPTQTTSTLDGEKGANSKNKRRLTEIATFVGNMVMMNPNVSRIWQL